jgi:hypothetical protein
LYYLKLSVSFMDSRRKQMRLKTYSAKIDLYVPPNRGIRLQQNGLGIAHAGHVDENVNVSDFRKNLVKHGIHLLLLAHVARKRQRLGAMAFAEFDGLREVGDGEIQKDDSSCTCQGKVQCNLLAYTATRP